MHDVNFVFFRSLDKSHLREKLVGTSISIAISQRRNFEKKTLDFDRLSHQHSKACSKATQTKTFRLWFIRNLSAGDDKMQCGTNPARLDNEMYQEIRYHDALELHSTNTQLGLKVSSIFEAQRSEL